MSLTDALRHVLARRSRDGQTVSERLAEVIVSKALSGDIRFIRLIFEIDRRDGLGAAPPAAEPVAGRIVIEPTETRPIPLQRRRAV